METHMKRKTWILVVVFIFGFLILILPDDGTAVFRLNEKHGPSWADILGLLLIGIGWAGLSYRAVINWKLITETFGKTNARLLLALYCISILGIAIALTIGIEWILWMSTAIASIINFSFIIVAFPRRLSTQ
jgi:hypothetical protein